MKRIHDSLLIVVAAVCCIMIPFFIWAQEGEVKDTHVLPSGFAMKIERMGGYLGSYSAFWIYPDGQAINVLGEAAKIPSEVVELWMKADIPYIAPPMPGASTGVGERPLLIEQLCFDCSGYQITIYDKERGRVRGFYGSTAEVTKTFPDLIKRLQHLAWSPLMGEPEDPDLPRRKPEGPPLPPRRNLRQPINVGGNVQASKLIRKVEPVYPELAKRARVAETVILVITVDEEGNVTDLEIQKGHPLLDQATIEAVKQWKYSPTLLNGEPVPVSFVVTVFYSFTASGETAISVGGEHF